MKNRTAYFLAVAVSIAGPSCSDDSTPTDPGGASSDTAPPAQITGATMSYARPGSSAVLSWTAPADDREPRTVARYEIRYGYSFPFNWELALEATDPPPPKAPGESETWTLGDPARGTELYAAIRSFDGRGNASPVSNIANVHITGFQLSAQCVDVLSRAPVEGLAATITARHVFEHTSDSNGAFARNDLGGGAVNVALRSGAASTLYHHIDHAFVLDSDIDLFYDMIPYQPVPSTLIDNALQLLLAAATGLNFSTELKKWNTIPVDIHVPAFTNIYGVDYEALVLSAITRWETRTGCDLFQVVGSVPATGIEFRYPPRAVMGIQNAFTEHFDDADQFPLRDIVRVLDEFQVVGVDKLSRILLHELGHTIRLNHLPSGFIMFGGQPLPADISDDEVLAVQLHTALPNGIDMSFYNFAAPTP